MPEDGYSDRVGGREGPYSDPVMQRAEWRFASALRWGITKGHLQLSFHEYGLRTIPTCSRSRGRR
jgi:hypothetical protein